MNVYFVFSFYVSTYSPGIIPLYFILVDMAEFHLKNYTNGSVYLNIKAKALL